MPGCGPTRDTPSPGEEACVRLSTFRSRTGQWSHTPDQQHRVTSEPTGAGGQAWHRHLGQRLRMGPAAAATDMYVVARPRPESQLTYMAPLELTTEFVLGGIR